jgi:LysM repeat protein
VRQTRAMQAVIVTSLLAVAMIVNVSCSAPGPPPPTPLRPSPTATHTHEPSPTPTETPTPEPIIYTVQPGDTLSAIASRFDTTVQAIMELNGITSTTIYSGTKLRIPSGEQPVSPPAEPEPTEVVSAAPTEVVPPTPATVPSVAPEAGAEDWGEICQPSPTEEGQLVANLTTGTTVQLQGYLYVKSFSMIREGMMPFTLREFPYGAGTAGWSEACQIHVFIPVGSGPNHVIELPDEFQMGDVVVWDKTGREIRGWQRNLDSYHVRLVSLVVEPYGGETGLGGSNTIRLQEIELLES